MKWKRGQEGRQRYISTYNIYMYIICTRHARIRLPGKVMRQLSEKNTSEHFKAPQKPRLSSKLDKLEQFQRVVRLILHLIRPRKVFKRCWDATSQSQLLQKLKEPREFRQLYFISYHLYLPARGYNRFVWGIHIVWQEEGGVAELKFFVWLRS